MMPKITELDINPVIEESEEDRQTVGGSFLFDFETGDFVTKDGKLVPVEGKDAVKMWVEKTLRTERFQFDVYEGTEYGVLIRDLIGTSYPKAFIEAEMKREITESLEEHPAIDNITNWSLVRDGSRAIVSFRIETIYGSEEMEVPMHG